MMVDLNKFKHINDYYGHESGDYILKNFVKQLKDQVQGFDLLARIGGDEFVVVIKNVKDIMAVGKVAKRIVNISQVPYMQNGKELICSASVGIACCSMTTINSDALMRHADLALYRAKSIPEGYFYFLA